MITINQILNDTYKIISEIGSGGGGVVYKAYHLRLEKYVAVKLIKDNVKGVINERAEADILKRLKHEGLPQVYDFVTDGGDVYTVMDFIDGRSLFDEIASRRKIPYRQALEWSKQLCAAAAYLHTRKPAIIHSDIKPQNIMITTEGKVCLIDFNISSVFDGNTYTIGSSDGYSPPEQYAAINAASGYRSSQSAADNDTTEIISDKKSSISSDDDTVPIDNSSERTEVARGIIDARSDVYSIGAVMYSMVTGYKPNNSQRRITPIKQLDESIPEAFVYIIEKAMSREKKDRFSSASEMLSALNNINRLDRRYKRMKLRHELAYIFCVCLLAASVISIIAGTQMMSSESDELFNSYVLEMTKISELDDYREFDEIYEKFSAEYPDKPEPFYFKALKIYRSEEYDEAQQYINENLMDRLDELSEEMRADIYFMYADILFRNEDYLNAAEYYTEAVSYDPENPDIYRDYAISLARNGDAENAEKIMNIAIKHQLSEDGIYMVTGEICFVRGEYAAAVEAVKKVISVTEDLNLKRNAYLLCSRAYQAMNNGSSTEYITDDIELLKKALLDIPQEYSLQLREYLAQEYINYGEISGRDDYFAEAYIIICNMKELGWETYQSDMNLAVLLDKVGNTKGAVDLLREMSENPLYENNYYKIYIRLARLEAAAQNELDQSERSYSDFEKYYSLAEKYYSEYLQNGSSDPEMESLKQLYSNLADLGWI